MNILIYSYNFFPQADPESYCSTRFASALARAGHNVTVVTMDWPIQVSKESYESLVAKELKIIRVPFSSQKNTPLKGLLIYGHKSQMAVDVPKSVNVVKRELKAMNSPILVTRSLPIASAMVGLKTYRFAAKWVVHFSDPVPWVNYANTIGHKLLRRLERNIIKKSFLKSDKISLTCEYAKKYFKDEFGSAFDENKVVVLNHIGDYRLSQPIDYNQQRKPILMHCGMIYFNRGADIIKDIMVDFESEGYDCEFIQVGSVDKTVKKYLEGLEHIKVYDSSSLEESITARKFARVLFIPDFQVSLPYSPFLLSKFVYQVMENIPIVVYSLKNSEMHDFVDKYPKSGIFWAETGDKESLKSAIKSAMECNPENFDRTEIRKCFAEETIVKVFEDAVNMQC